MDLNDKRIIELERDKAIDARADVERKTSDEKYAIKLTEKAVFAIVGLMGLTVAGTLIKVAIDYIGAIFK